MKQEKTTNKKGFLYLILLFLFISPVFAITTDTSGAPLTAIIMTPLILGLFFILSAFILDPVEHLVIRIFLFITSFMTFFISSWFGMITIVKYYDFAPMQDAISTSVLVMGIMIIVVIFYFLIYAFYKGVHAAAQRKKEMMLQ